MKISLIRVNGVDSLYINDYRYIGPKPWGGGSIYKEWTITKKDDLIKIKKSIEMELEKGLEKELKE